MMLGFYSESLIFSQQMNQNRSFRINAFSFLLKRSNVFANDSGPITKSSHLLDQEKINILI
jgi:hypothetical protein